MATHSSSLAYKHWQRILHLWPTDLVRPKAVSFQHVMRQRLSKIHPPSPTSSQNAAAESIHSNGALVSAVPPPLSSSETSSWNERHQLAQTNALYSLLENRYANANPIPATLRKPSSDPEHYDVLVRELEEAPKRSWLGGVWKRLKGSLRFS